MSTSLFLNNICKAERLLWGASPETPECAALVRALALGTIPDSDRISAKERVQPRNLRGADGRAKRETASNRSRRLADDRIEEIIAKHLNGDAYVGVVALNKRGETWWMQIDCDFALADYLHENDLTTEALLTKIAELGDRIAPGFHPFVRHTRNNWALDFFFEAPISRADQQAIYAHFCLGLNFGPPIDGVHFQAECLPDNPLTDKHGNVVDPTGKTPILPLHASRLEGAQRAGIGLDGSTSWPEPLPIEAVTALRSKLEGHGLAFDPYMPTFYKTFREFTGKSSSRDNNVVPFPKAQQKSNGSAKKENDTEVPDDDAVVEKMQELAAVSNIALPAYAETLMLKLSPCVRMKMWQPEIGPQGHQNKWGRHLADAIRRARDMGIIDDDEIVEAFRTFAYLIAQDGDAPGEIEREMVRKQMRALTDTSGRSNPSCTECQSAGLCNIRVCGSVEAGYIRRKSQENMQAAGIEPLFIATHAPFQIIHKVHGELIAIVPPDGSDIKVIIEHLRAETIPLPQRTPQPAAFYNECTRLPRLTMAQIRVQTNYAPIRNYFSLDLATHRYVVDRFLTPVRRLRVVNQRAADEPTMLPNDPVAIDDSFLYVGRYALQQAVFAAMRSDNGLNHINGTTSDHATGFWTRGDTKAPSFADHVKTPFLPKGRWCKVALTDIDAIEGRIADI